MTNVTPASPAEIDTFLKAAEDYYAEAGIDPKTAAPLFDREIVAIAGHLFDKENAHTPEHAAKEVMGPAKLDEVLAKTPKGKKDDVLQALRKQKPAKKEAKDEEVYKAAMDRMFELGIPKDKAEELLVGFVDKQAKERRIEQGVDHLLGKVAAKQKPKAKDKKKKAKMPMKYSKVSPRAQKFATKVKTALAS